MVEFKPMTRVNYYDGQLLDADLFKLEQTYTANLTDYHNAALFSPGVVCGLEVTALGGTVFSISEGFAIDDDGRQLVWPCGGPAQTLSGHGICHDGSVQVWLRYNQTLICEKGQRAPDCDITSLLPKVVHDDSSGGAVMIAVLTISGGVITDVDNSKTGVTLNVPASGDIIPVNPSHLSGCSTFHVSLRPNDLVWKRVNFNFEGKPAFQTPPIVTVSPVSDNLCIYALSINSVTVAGFTVGITWLAGEQHHPHEEYRVTVNWRASDPSSNVPITGGADEPTY